MFSHLFGLPKLSSFSSLFDLSPHPFVYLTRSPTSCRQLNLTAASSSIFRNIIIHANNEDVENFIVSLDRIVHPQTNVPPAIPNPWKRMRLLEKLVNQTDFDFHRTRTARFLPQLRERVFPSSPSHSFGFPSQIWFESMLSYISMLPTYSWKL